MSQHITSFVDPTGLMRKEAYERLDVVYAALPDVARDDFLALVATLIGPNTLEVVPAVRSWYELHVRLCSAKVREEVWSLE